MAFADDMFLLSGTYAIVNFEYNRSIAFSEQEECLSTSSDDYGWTISFLANKKWTTQGPSDVFVDIPPEPEAGEDVSSVKNPPKPHQWAIKRHAGEAQSYIIYSPSRPDLFWRLPNADERVAPQLDVDHTSRPSLWKFKKIQNSVADIRLDSLIIPLSNKPEPMTQFVATPVQRPTQLDSAIKNRFALAIPAGWLTTITAVSCGNSVNLVRVRRAVNGALEKQDLVSGWDAIDKAMTADGSDSNSLALPTVEEAYVLVVEVSTPKSGKKGSTSQTSRPNDMKSFPDFETFTASIPQSFRISLIFDESLDAPDFGRTQNVIITIHTSVKVAVDLDDPGKPEPDTVNKGYNEDMDRPRPGYLDQWLEKYRAVIVVDDSSAMAINVAWAKDKDAVLRVVTEVMQYDTSGIDIYFLNSLLFRNAITAPEEVVQVFELIKPQGPSPIGARFEFLLGEIIDDLEQVKHNAADYGQVKPINIIVLTNSPPSDNPTKVIRSAARKLNEGLHHSNAVTIQFAQIGSDNHVKQALKKLSDDPSLSTPKDGMKLGTESLRVLPDAQSPLTSRFLYYGVYTEGGASTSKVPVDPEEAWVSRIDLDLVPPPLSVASLLRFISAKERITSSSQLFADQDGLAPLSDNHILVNDGKWPGSTADDHVMFKFCSRPGGGNAGGSIRNGEYFIVNCATRGNWWIWVESNQPLAPVSVYPPNESDSPPAAHRVVLGKDA
ncbi:hypothetical protein B0H13DRAFT_1855853 [Mycena leptocephala]|nr:hypothetical protein B0H13DRAFT_1855853 [Mycena leptocephala]